MASTARMTRSTASGVARVDRLLIRFLKRQIVGVLPLTENLISKLPKIKISPLILFQQTIRSSCSQDLHFQCSKKSPRSDVLSTFIILSLLSHQSQENRFLLISGSCHLFIADSFDKVRLFLIFQTPCLKSAHSYYFMSKCMNYLSVTPLSFCMSLFILKFY